MTGRSRATNDQDASGVVSRCDHPNICVGHEYPAYEPCGLRLDGNECRRPTGHSGLCYDEASKVAFEDGWWADDRGNGSSDASGVRRGWDCDQHGHLPLMSGNCDICGQRVVPAAARGES